MADGVHGGDAVSWLQWALGGVTAALGLLIGWLFARIEGVRSEAADGRKAIWDRLNQRTDAAADDRLEDAQRYATQNDLDKLEERLGDRLSETETRIMNAINDRGPVRTR